MYIKKEDHDYLSKLFQNLNESQMRNLMNHLLAAAKEKSGHYFDKIKIIDDSIRDIQAIDPLEIITRTMIKKAYKAIKEGKKS